jgi:hypothetical protein
MVSNVYRVSCRRWGSSVNTVTGAVDRVTEVSCFDSRRAQDIFFLVFKESRMALGPSQPHIPGVTTLFRGVKLNTQPPYCANVKNAWSINYTPPHGFHEVLIFSFNGMFCI